MTTIFHPTDFSQQSNIAFLHALRMTLVTRGNLEVLHVDTRNGNVDWIEYPHVRSTLHEWGILSSELSIDDLMKRTGISIRKAQIEGNDIVRAVGQHLSRHPSDLMVLSTEGRSGISELISPSISASLAAAIMRPTLFFREGHKGFVTKIGRIASLNILVATDNEPDPQIQFDYLYELSRILGSSLHKVVALHCGDGPLKVPIIFNLRGNAKYEQIVRPGDVVEGINQYAREMKADLIVMASAGPGSLKENIFGSTTRRVLKGSPCPVLSIPTPSYSAQPPV